MHGWWGWNGTRALGTSLAVPSVVQQSHHTTQQFHSQAAPRMDEDTHLPENLYMFAAALFVLVKVERKTK